MSEIYTPREFIDAINKSNPKGVRFDPYNTDPLRAQLQAKQAERGDIFAQAKSEVDERARERQANSPEAKILEAQAQIEAMKQWLIQDGTYTPQEVQEKVGRLEVEYDEASQEAVVNGYLDLHGLTSAEGLTLPTTIGGGLSLYNLTSAKDLTLPITTIGGKLYLNGLTSTEGLTLPTTIGGGLDLSNLTSAEGLTLPTTIGGDLYLDSLPRSDKQALRDKYPHLKDKI